MSKFLRYCATVMTAHILTKEGSRKWTWVNAPDDIEDHEWVKNCRAGVLSYPPEPVNWGPMTALPANASDDELADYSATSCAMIIEEAEKFMLRGSGHGIDRVLRF